MIPARPRGAQPQGLVRREPSTHLRQVVRCEFPHHTPGGKGVARRPSHRRLLPCQQHAGLLTPPYVRSGESDAREHAGCGAPSTGRSGCSARAQEIRSETRTGNGGRRLVWRSARASTTIKGAQSRNPSPRGMVVASPISWARLGSALKSAATAATGIPSVLLSGSVDVLPEQDRAAPAHDRRRPVRRHSPGLVQAFHAARCGHHSGAPDRVGGENTTPASRHPWEGPITRQMCHRAPASRVLSAAGRMAGPGAVLQVALRLGGYICQMSHDDMYRGERIVVVRCCSFFEPFGVCDRNLVPAQQNVHDLFAGLFIAVQVRMANSLHCSAQLANGASLCSKCSNTHTSKHGMEMTSWMGSGSRLRSRRYLMRSRAR